jgi:hypothetical protein
MADLPTAPAPIPGFGSKITLPPELVANDRILEILKKGVTQWSRIAAWSWCDYLAFKGDSVKEPQEKNLKAFLYKALTEQAKNSDGYLSYGDEPSQAVANAWSKAIVNLLLGKNDDAVKDTDYEGKDMGVTLSDVIFKSTGEPLVTSLPDNESFVKLFYVQITRDAYSGRVIRASEEDATTYTGYINIIAYPPRPQLSDYTVTEQQLIDWASNTNDTGDYLPPSAYIPIATT